MTRKHFEALARALTEIYRSLCQSGHYHEVIREMIVKEMCHFCREQNPRFSQETFIRKIKTLIEEDKQMIKENLTRRSQQKSEAIASPDKK